MDLFLGFILHFLWNTNAAAKSFVGHNRYRPHIAKRFVGVLVDGEAKVQLNPPLAATDKDAPQLSGLICEYQITQIYNSEKEVPFSISILDKRTGVAEITLKANYSSITCSNQTEYQFRIQALDCGSLTDGYGSFFNQRVSRSSTLYIAIQHINNHAPYFLNPVYAVRTEDNIIPDSPLVSLNAQDEDCTLEFGSICKFEVDNGLEELFTVSNQGILTALTRIDAFDGDIIFNLSVVAYDCGGLKSNPAHVILTVLQPCQAGLSGIERAIEFITSEETSVALTTNPIFNACISRRDIVNVMITVSLHVDELDAMRECNFTLQLNEEERRFCDATDPELIELLPSFSMIKHMARSGIDCLPDVEKSLGDSKQLNYNFNGYNQVLEIADVKIDQTLTYFNLTQPFAMFFNLFLTSENRDEKWTVICKADQNGSNRHHFAIYIQNCHLMLLLRLERGASHKLTPAEWHWKLGDGKNCTGKWFQIWLNIEYPFASLKVNGEELVPFLIADDFPLHSSFRQQIWSIGAAWKGRENKFDQYFHGKLSNLHIFLNRFGNWDLMQLCTNRCKEGLAYGGSENSTPNSLTQYSMSFVSNGSDIDGVLRELRKVFYFNRYKVPILGPRQIRLESRIRCSPTATFCPFSTPKQIYVNVIPPSDPRILLAGKTNVVYNLNDLQQLDMQPFNDLLITSEAESTSNSTAEPHIPVLKSCIVNVTGDNGKGDFYIRPSSLIRRHRLKTERLFNAIKIKGPSEIEAFQNVLRFLSYRNLFTEDIDNAIEFAAFCTTSNGRYHSNTYRLLMTLSSDESTLIPDTDDVSDDIIDDQQLLITPAALQAPEFEARLNVAEETEILAGHLGLSKSAKNTFNVVAIVIGGTVGVVAIFIVVMLLARFRDCGFEEEAEDLVKDQEMGEIGEEELDWDDSALTITVNPMDDEASDADFSEIDDEEFGFVSDQETSRDE